MSSDPSPAGLPSVGILGGTGAQGRGLARRFAAAGHRVVLGSREPDRAVAAAEPYGERVTGADNAAAASADLVVVAVPYAGHADLLRPLADLLAGKVVVDCVNPLGFDERGPYALAVPAGSAAEEAQELLPRSVVVAAFHHVSAVLLDDPAVDSVDLDVLVLGDDRDAVGRVCDLAATIPGARGVPAGRLRLAGPVEALTASLIAVNRRFRTHAGLRLTGLP